MHTAFDKTQPNDLLENLRVLDSDGVKGRVNRQRACLLEGRGADDGIQAGEGGEMQIRGASSQVNAGAHRDL